MDPAPHGRPCLFRVWFHGSPQHPSHRTRPAVVQRWIVVFYFLAQSVHPPWFRHLFQPGQDASGPPPPTLVHTFLPSTSGSSFPSFLWKGPFSPNRSDVERKVDRSTVPGRASHRPRRARPRQCTMSEFKVSKVRPSRRTTRTKGRGKRRTRRRNASCEGKGMRREREADGDDGRRSTRN